MGTVDAAPGVESEAIVLGRALHALEGLVPAATVGGPIAVASHDAVIRPILTNIQPGISPVIETGP